MRRIPRILVGCLCLTLLLSVPCLAKEWRGIMPLHTTRSEVVKLLGEPKHTWETVSGYFDLPDARVTIEWIDPTCAREYPTYTLQKDGSPDDLVLNIYVFPKKLLPAKDVEWPGPDTLYSTMGCHPGGPCTLWSHASGFGFTSTKDGIKTLYYGPTEAEFKTWSEGHQSCRRSAKSPT